MSHSMLLHPVQVPEKIGFEQVREALIAKAQTALGRERAEALHPSIHKDEVERQLQETDEFMRMQVIEGHVPVDPMPDIREALVASKIEGRALDATTMLHILQVAEQTRRLRQFFAPRAETYPVTAALALSMQTFSELEKDIRAVIDENGLVRDNASKTLRDIRAKLSRTRGQLRNSLQKALRMAQSDNMAGDEGITIRNGRMVIPIRAEYKRRMSGFIHDVSATGHTVYMEPAESLQLNNDLRELESEELREIERILRSLTDLVRDVRLSLHETVDLYGHLDLIAAKARLGMSMQATIPAISQDREVFLMDARNPNLLLRFKKRDEVIPLNLQLLPSERCLIITGPNAGGKSVAMKTLGLCCYMAQCGLALPARGDTRLPLLDGLFVDLGDEQSVENDLSTFSSRLKWMKETWEAATPDSLVLIDEAGTGTDPDEGSALYQAFLSYLTRKHTLSIVTTHHGRLKAFAHDTEGVLNGSMEFDQHQLVPTYHFLKGVPGSSYAFEIARRMGIPELILSIARSLTGEQKQQLESLIMALEHEKQEASKAQAEARRQTELAKEQLAQFDEKRSNFLSSRDNILKQAEAEAKRILAQANAIIEQEVQKIKLAQADKEAIKEARHTILQTQQQLEKRLKKRSQTGQTIKEPVQIGDWVSVAGSAMEGELIEIKGQQVQVQTETITIRTTLEQVSKAKRPTQKKKKAGFSTYADVAASLKVYTNRLDIRGMRGEDALTELRDFIDNAKLSGWNQLEIVHGKGHGILQELVHNYLKTRKDIKKYHFASWEHGGTGCTMIEV